MDRMNGFSDRDPAERSAFNRLFYRDCRPTWFGHWVSQFFCWWARLGLPPRSWFALDVRDRVSGRMRADAVVVVTTVAGERYIVSMFGTISDWVHNIEAANGEAAVSHGGTQRVRLVAVPREERAPILREYVRVASSGRKHFPLPVGAPLADFAAIASQYPVYRIEVAASRRPNTPQGRGSDPARIESYLSALTATSKTPGIQYRVVTPTGVQYEHASGWADIRRRVPLDSATTLMAYSMSKTITAVAALQLVESGQVGLDDPVERYLGSLPYGSSVTVRQLISHTSGIPNPIPLRWVHPAEHHGSFDEDAALAAVLQKHPRLLFAPGSKYAYSNIGYWLLGKIVERASGENFASYVTERILGALVIEPRDLGYIVADPAHHATGYLEKYSFMNLVKGLLIDRTLVAGYSGRWLAIRSHYLNGPAFGGLVGTARGFGTFLQDQLRERSVLFNDTTRQLFYAQQQTTRGISIAMTLGWHIGDRDGRRFFYKEGGGGGFHCMMRLYPRGGVGTVAMTNATGFDVGKLLDTIDASFLRDDASRVGEPPPKLN
jgi:D-alanyl-D-alanine carboxypeptidase